MDYPEGMGTSPIRQALRACSEEDAVALLGHALWAVSYTHLCNCESSTSFDEADHVDFLLAVSSDREAGNTDIELRAKRRNDCRKFSVLCGRAFQAHDMRDRIGHIDVITGGGGAI